MIINIYNSRGGEVLYHELDNFMKNAGYEIVRIRINKNRKIRKCQIMIERTDNRSISIMDCEKVNKEVVRILKNNLLEFKDFNIEVSSPGIDKPLTRLKDYVVSKEKIVRIYTLYQIQNRRNFRCYIKGVDENAVKVKLVDTGEIITLDFTSISEAYLQYKTLIN